MRLGEEPANRIAPDNLFKEQDLFLRNRSSVRRVSAELVCDGEQKYTRPTPSSEGKTVADTRWILVIRPFASRSTRVRQPSRYSSRQILRRFPRSVGVPR